MKPAPFRYHAPASLTEALDLLSALDGEDADARVLAGGQSLVPMLNLRLAQPEHLVDLGGIAELTDISIDDGHLVIGAMVRQRSAEHHADVASGCPLLADAMPQVGHPQTRNRGTIGGSLAHADPAAEVPTVAAVLDAQVTLATAEGERHVAAADFFLGYLETDIRPGELLTQVRFPRPARRTGTAFSEVSRRHNDFAMVGVGCAVQLEDDGTIADARVGVLGAGSTAVRATSAEESLRGAPADADAFAAAASRLSEELDPPADLHASAEYRRHVAGVLAQRALATATDRARTTGERGPHR